jgi:heptaprenyl diphosphate synthase
VTAVDELMFAALDSAPPSLRDPCRRLAGAGGKRLRAQLLLAAADGHPSAATAAAAVELLHLATLVHDDLIDDSPVRRGVPTINAKEGPAIALLAGDLLIGLAGRLATATGGPVRALFDDALVDLCEGQALEADNRFRADADAATVLRTARLKTGTLLGLGGEIGGLLREPADAAGLRAFGLDFGTLLQLLDDLLDLLSDEPTYGKPTGVDFAAGTVTLPAVHGLAASADLRTLLRPGLDAAARQRANDLLRAGPGIAATLAAIGEHARRARRRAVAAGAGALADLPERYVVRQLGLVIPPYRHHLERFRAPSRVIGAG